MNHGILAQQFFNRPAPRVARELLGKYLVRRRGRKEIALMITETEAYEGFNDRASHASRGKTKRNAPMFGEAGIFYVYLCYGMYWMLNVVTGEKGYPAAVLIRGGKGEEKGIKGERGITERVAGPGRVSRLFLINKRLNALPAEKNTGLWFEDRGVKIAARAIQKTPRIGVAYAGEEWAGKLYRFALK